MINDSLFTFLCAGLIGLLFGTALAFAGYRLFIFLLPVWGFFFGLALGAQSIQALFGVGFLATITSWVVGFLVGAIFAVLSYAFYLIAVAIIGASLGYVVLVSLLTGIGLQFGFLVWLIGIVAAIAMAFVTIRYNLQKWVVIIATSLLGTGVIFGTIVLMFNPVGKLMSNPVSTFLSFSPFMTVVAIVVAVLAVIFQVRTTESLVIEEYNRMGSTTA